MSFKDKLKEFVDDITSFPKDFTYIKEKNARIKELLEEANLKLEPTRVEVNHKLEELGKVKVEISTTVLEEFTKHMSEIQNLPFTSESSSSVLDHSFSFSQKDLKELEVSVVSVKNILKNSVEAGATGAISAGAAYSVVAAFGAASTGTLMSTISGVAASNATLAWLGGGALAVGGGGIALGTIVLGGIAIVPAVSYFIWKGKFNYANEREIVDKNYQEALDYSNNIDSIIKNFNELKRLIDNTIKLINRYSLECIKLNKQTDCIKNQIGLNYEKYTKEQKSLVQKHIQYIARLISLINTPIMNKDGSCNQEMIQIIREVDTFLNSARTIEFTNCEKKTPIWIYAGILLTLVCAYVLYKLIF